MRSVYSNVYTRVVGCCSALYHVAVCSMLLSKLQSRVYNRGSAIMHQYLLTYIVLAYAPHSLHFARFVTCTTAVYVSQHLLFNVMQAAVQQPESMRTQPRTRSS
jgi:hypothetical protein